MRITSNRMSDNIIENLNIDLARLSDYNQQISSGKRIVKPSDDPVGAHRVVNINEALAGITQYQRNIGFVKNWLNASETSLQDAADALSSANTLATRGANDATLTQDDLNALADNVDGLINNLVKSGNVTLEGKYIFGGYQTQTPPFTTVMTGNSITAVNYAGDTGVEQMEVDLGQTVNRNIPGSDVFQPASGVDVFSALIQLRDDLRAGNIAGVKTAITTTQTARQQIATQISFIGNKADLLAMTEENMSEKKLGLVSLNSKLAETDMPDAIVHLQTAQDVYTAALQSSAKVLQQQSLMNFLN